MRTVVIVMVLGLLSSCAVKSLETIACVEPRPQVCTMEFAPCCAALKDGSLKEFSSPCTACADPTVTGYVSGHCPG